MSESIKKNVNRFVKQHHIKAVSYSALREAVKNIGFSIIEFNNIYNDKDVEIIIQNLKLNEAVLRSRGFTYADKNYRLIFINEDLSDDEKIYILSHELGHIVCGHYNTAPIIGRDIKEEHEANEFSHYLLKQNHLRNLSVAISRHKRMVTIFASVLLVISALVVVGTIKKDKSYYSDFYITATGSKYHQAECIHIKNNNNVERLTKEQFESGEYKPCGTCLPQG